MKYWFPINIIYPVFIFLFGFLPAVNASPGDLDTTFSQDGISTEVFAEGIAYATAIQADGKIVVIGIGSYSQTTFTIVRYNTDGSLDTSFDGDGKVSTAVVNSSYSAPGGVAIQPDGKIVVAGSVSLSNLEFGVVRYNTDGSLDITFDGDGMMTTPAADSAHDHLNSIALQPDGKIVLEGRSQRLVTGGEFGSLVRLNADGSLDTTFDTDGKLAPIPLITQSRDVAVQPDGKIVVAGYGSEGSSFGYVILRLNPNGLFDNSFDGDGRVVTPIRRSDSAECVFIQPDGKIVAGGSSYHLSANFYDFAVVRYNPNGSLDTTFDGDGKATTLWGNSQSVVNDITVQSDGKIVAAGTVYNGNGDFGIARYNLDGSLDGSYGTGGKSFFDIGGNNGDTLLGITLDSNNRAVVVGRGDSFFTAARVIGNVTSINPPFDFDNDNKTDISIFRPSNGQWWINRGSNGSVAVAQFGVSTDKIVPGDYTGDGKTDVAVWRPASGEWFVLRTEENSYYSVPFGAAGDVPVPADFDGDEKADLAVFRPSSGTWFINKSGGGTDIINFGQTGDLPVTGDYDRDGKADIAAYRPSTGVWYIIRSSNSSFLFFQFGNSSDKPVQGDYTGDGRTDIAVYRPSTGFWYILKSEDFSSYAVPFGANGDIPSPGDYDGDGKFDFAVFRPTEGNWYINRSTAGFLIMTFGISSDKPVPSAFLP